MASPMDTAQTSEAAAAATTQEQVPSVEAKTEQVESTPTAALSTAEPATSGSSSSGAVAQPRTAPSGESTAAKTPAPPSYPDPIVYLPGSSSASSSASSLRAAAAAASPAESEPKPTADELKAAYASTIERNRRMGVGPDAPLMTQAMRERQEARLGGSAAKGKKAFEEVRIRLRFPDRTMLEYTLPSTTSVAYLYPLLRSALDPAVAKSKPFTLYTSPPKMDFPESDLLGTTPAAKKAPLRGSAGSGSAFSAGAAAGAQLRGKKIGEMGWGGAVVINIRWTGAGDEGMNSSGAGAGAAAAAGSSSAKSRLGFGSKDKDKDSSGGGGAAAVTAPIRQDLKARAREVEAPKMGVQAEGSSSAAGASSSKMGGGGQTLGGGPGADASKEKKVPKWFKGFKK